MADKSLFAVNVLAWSAQFRSHHLRRIKMNWSLVHMIVLFVVTAIVIVMDDANWDRKKPK